VTGDAPQPGETPRNEVDPWAFADAEASWWRGDTDQPGDDTRPHRHSAPNHAATGATGGTGVLLPPGHHRDDTRTEPSPLAGPQPAGTAEAFAAAVRDVEGGLDPAVAPRTDEAPAGVERDHDQPDPFRYDPLRPPAGHTARQAARTVAADQDQAGTRTPADGPAPEPGDAPPRPEPDAHDRPAVVLDRGGVPGQGPPGHARPSPGEPLPRPTGTPATDARLAKLENSPFWLSDQERAAIPPAAARPSHTATGDRRGPRHVNRRTAPALTALIVLALISTFFAWVSAEPFWIAMGHGDPGYATTARCVGSGVTQRCTGQFAAADGSFSVNRVTLLGVGAGQRENGTVAPARMVSPDSRQAYLGDTGLLVQLRWILGFLLVLICGYAIAGLTGARRLDTARARRGAVLISLAGPLVLLAGFLLAAY